MRYAFSSLVLALAACGPVPPEPATEHPALPHEAPPEEPDAEPPSTDEPPSGTDETPDEAPSCPRGEACNPIPIDTLPFVDEGDTSQATSFTIDTYGCAPTTWESGAEVFYVIEVAERGVLSARVDDVAGDGVDIDVHLLADTSAESCLARDNEAVHWPVEPGRYFIVIDTWAKSDGTTFPGPYTLSMEFAAFATGPCALQRVDQKMYWSACAAGIDCYAAEEDGRLYHYLRTPAFGPVVKEAHLVTVEDDFDGSWPSSLRDQIEEHYALSQAATGYVMQRTQDWAPAGEGGSEYGQSASAVPLPVVDEAWYVNMYWRPRPPKGTRLIAFNPNNGRAVVLAGGYETGPGSNTAIGGMSEEAHHYLGSNHRSELILGFAAQEDLPLGPIDCW